MFNDTPARKTDRLLGVRKAALELRMHLKKKMFYSRYSGIVFGEMA